MRYFNTDILPGCDLGLLDPQEHLGLKQIDIITKLGERTRVNNGND